MSNSWFELEKVAKERGKVSYWAWVEAKRLGADPVPLGEQERAARAEYIREDDKAVAEL